MFGSQDDRDHAPRQIYDVYIGRVQRGEPADFAELCAAHPHIADQLRELHGQQDTLRQQRQSSVAFLKGSSTAAMPVPPPAGRYERRRRLARGGMGVIYTVWDKLLHRRLAMKVVRQQEAPREPAAPADPQVLARFVREAEITARLDHPGVVPIHDLGVDENGRVFFTMRLIHGKSLASVMQQARQDRQTWPQTRVIDVIVKVCETVAYAHSRGVIHRDLKPDNIMVGAFGETYVMDWGLAKLRQPAVEQSAAETAAPRDETVTISQAAESPSGKACGSSAEETEMGCVMGTAFYMPPEQAAGRIDQLDERSDIYSVGAILYQLLCGQKPYAVDGRVMTFGEVVEAVLAGPPESIKEINPRVPLELVAICEKAMARTRVQRYQTMLEMAEDLRAYLEHRVVRAYQTGAWAELKKWVKRNRGLAVASALVLAVSISGLLGVVGVQSRANTRLSKANNDILAANRQIVAESNQKEAALKAKTAALQAAEDERRRAEGTYLARQAMDVVERDPSLALLLALESHQKHPGYESDTALFSALRSHRELRTMYGHWGPIKAGALSSNRKRLVTAADDRTAIVWDLEHGQPLAWLLGHGDWVRSVEFSPDGQRIVTASGDGTAALWDAASGRRLQLLNGRSGRVYSASFSSDGHRLVTASVDRTARVWDVETGALELVLSRHTAAVYHAVFSPDDNQIATASADGTARLWDSSTGQAQQVLAGHHGGVAQVLFTADSRRVLTAAWENALPSPDDVTRRSRPSTDTEVRLFNAQTGELERTFEHRAVVSAFSVDASNDSLAAGCLDGSIALWNLETGRCEHLFQAASGVQAIAFSPDGQTFAVGTGAGVVLLIDALTGAKLTELRGHSNTVSEIKFASNEQLLSVSQDQTVRAWSLYPMGEIPPLHGGEGGSLQVSPDGSRFLARTAARVRLGALPGGKLIADLPQAGAVLQAVFSRDGQAVATVSQGKVYLWSASDGKLLAGLPEEGVNNVVFRDTGQLVLRSLARHTVTAWSWPDAKPLHRLVLPEWQHLVVSPGGNDVLALDDGAEKTVAEIWDVEREQCAARLVGQAGELRSGGAFSPDGTRLATWSGKIPQPRLWETATGRRVAILKTSGQVGHVSFSGDSRVLLTFGRDALARTWDARNGAPIATLAGFEPSSGLSFMGQTGTRVVVVANDGRSRLWDGRNGRMLQFLGEGDAAVKTACFGNDDKTLLTLNRKLDRVVIWDAWRGKRLALLDSAEKRFDDVALTPDGEWFVTTFSDGSTRVWPLSPAQVAAQRVSRPLTPDERDLYYVGADGLRANRRLTWAAQSLADFLLVVSRLRLDAPGQEQPARSTIAKRVAKFFDLLSSADPPGRDAAVAKAEEIINLQGGVAPMLKAVLVDAYRSLASDNTTKQSVESTAGRPHHLDTDPDK